MGNTVSNFVHKAVSTVKNTISDMFRRIAPPIVRYVVKHPFRTLGHIASCVLLLLPGVVTGPLLGLVGFVGSGIRAGSLAAGVQSAVGALSAGGIFAVLQSAAMGGYGTTVVAQTVGATVVAAEAVGAVIRAGQK